jgi:hypothetical protein
MITDTKEPTRGVDVWALVAVGAVSDWGRYLSRHDFPEIGSSGEHVLSEVQPERGRTFLVGLQGLIAREIEREDDRHQKLAGRRALATAQIRRVRVAHANRRAELLICHLGHVPSMAIH